MAFDLKETGTREGIVKHLSEMPTDPPKDCDAAQVAAIKELAIKEINTLSSSGVRVEVHSTATASMRAISVTVIPVNIRS